MSTGLSPNLTQRFYTWIGWKANYSIKGSPFQYEEDGLGYLIWSYDGPEVSICKIWKGSIPEVQTISYPQSQNDLDKIDFETNYKSNGNKALGNFLTDSMGNPIGNINSAGISNLAVALGATNYALSSLNSTLIQLASGATFTGSVENSFNQQSYSILLTSDQNGTLVVKQYIDAAGTRLTQTQTYSITANSGFARSGVVNGNYISLTFTNNGPSTTTTLNINTAYGTLPSATQLNNSPISINEVNGTNFTLGTKTSSLSFPITLSKEQTYSATVANITIANSASDFFYIAGSATKTVKILRVIVSGTQTTSGVRDFILVKRATNSTGGSPTTPVRTPYDSLFNSPTAVVTYNTGSATVGTPIGNIASKKYFIGTTTTTMVNELSFDFTGSMSPPTLRGSSEMLALNFNTQTATGNSLNLTIEWTEE
jgi:hypothetical protein